MCPSRLDSCVRMDDVLQSMNKWHVRHTLSCVEALGWCKWKMALCGATFNRRSLCAYHWLGCLQFYVNGPPAMLMDDGNLSYSGQCFARLPPTRVSQATSCPFPLSKSAKGFTTSQWTSLCAFAQCLRKVQ